MTSREGQVIEGWRILRLLGKGSYALVFLVEHVATKARAALKEVDVTRMNAKLLESLDQEISAMRRLQHGNVVRLLDLIRTEGRIYLVCEYCEAGDLAQLLRRRGRLSEAEARFLLGQLAAGLRALRSLHLVHRDLKPQNLLLAGAGPPSPAPAPSGTLPELAALTLKIADFGFARPLESDGLADTLCGSPLYMSPEILRFQRYDAKADLWSVGVLLFEMVAGRAPYGGSNPLELLADIERRDARLPPEVAATLSAGCVQLLEGLLRRRPVERMSFDQFFAHPFVAPALATAAAAAAALPPPSPPPDLGARRADAALQRISEGPSMMDTEAPFDFYSAALDHAPPTRQPSAASDPHARPHTTLHVFPQQQTSTSTQPSPSPLPPQPQHHHQHYISNSQTPLPLTEDSIDDFVIVSAQGSTDDLPHGAASAPLLHPSRPGSFSSGPPSHPHPHLPHAASLPRARTDAHPLALGPPAPGPYQPRPQPWPRDPGTAQGTGRHAAAPSLGPAPSRLSAGAPAAAPRAAAAPLPSGLAPVPPVVSLNRPCCQLERLRRLEGGFWALARGAEREARVGRPLAALSLSLLAAHVAAQLTTVLQGGCEVHLAGAHVHAQALPAWQPRVADAAESADRQARAAATMAGAGDREAPDPIEAVYECALAFGRAGATCELAGEPSDALACYRDATALFDFLLEEAALLPALAMAAGPLRLDAGDRAQIEVLALEVGRRARTLSLER